VGCGTMPPTSWRDILSRAKKLPAGLDKGAVEGARSGVETMTKTWADAQAAFTSGLTKLGMPVPDALKT
jgi:hypothetical protein